MPSQSNYQAMQMAVANKPALIGELQTNPNEGMKLLAEEMEKYTWEKDKVIYRTVVFVLSGVLIITVLALAVTLFVATVANAPVELIVGLGSTALGALAGLLAPSPVRTGG